MKNWGHIVREDLITRMREAHERQRKIWVTLLHRPREDLITRIRDLEKLEPYSKLLTS